MYDNNRLLAKSLTYGGTLPLVFCIAARFVHVENIDITFIAQTYSTIIVAFLCGIHWATYLFFADKCPRNLLITSNIITLLAWSSLFATNQPIATLLEVLCFLYLLTLDLKLRNAGLLPEWFYVLRRNATIIVILCLAILAGTS
ncbi:DUF3429 domain-containing protein (plasmid) [Legionella sp. D16C41]|uniref:DUF3429 domain-containing protein n=1 Tax=Legionella sp. D16C41 TaxID=3402688 RepID=UPI003AF9C570